MNHLKTLILILCLIFNKVKCYENLAKNGFAFHSSTYTNKHGTYNASRALDGNKDKHFRTGSCAHTGLNYTEAWWTLNLQRRAHIKSVKIYFRSGRAKRFKGFSLYISESFDIRNPASGYLCYQDTERNPATTQDKQCYHDGQYVVIYKGAQDAILEICEVKVLGCVFGFYGQNCKPCSKHCINDTCDKTTGRCTCKAGYHGSKCTNKCAKGYYGVNCRSICLNCNEYSCHHESGICTKGCKIGKQGHTCNGACEFGTFGNNCSSRCHCLHGDCNKETGGCYQGRCKPGWKLRTCSLACDFGTFGNNCSSRCHCLHGDCNKETGGCYQGRCKPGWKLRTCSLECEHGTFGDNCKQTCHCLNGENCDRITGRCPSGNCEEGWKPDTCSQGCDHGTFGASCNKTCNCLSGRNCNKDTGKCPYDKCELGWKPNTCSEVCDHGTFGDNCKNKCHCLNGKNCNRITGLCPSGRCEAGWKLETCSKDCDYGTFGESCGNTCHCQGHRNCNKTTGRCPFDRCDVGWKPDTCSQECDHGTFGENCNTICHCWNGENCNAKTGRCPSGRCEAGWKPNTCSQECENGNFGENCKQTCQCVNGQICNKATGECPGGKCEAGWKGRACSEVCEDFSFGENCRYTCHCLNNTSCDKRDGTCTVGFCDRGWTGSSCSQKCPIGWFGFDCHEQCTSCVNNTCDPEYGVCLTGCKAGKSGVKCTALYVDESNLESAGIGIGIGAVLVVLFLILAVIFVNKRRKDGKSKLPTLEPTPTQANIISTDRATNEDAGQMYANVESRESKHPGTDLTKISAAKSPTITFEVKDYDINDTDKVYSNTPIIQVASENSIQVTDLPFMVDKKRKHKEFDKEFLDLKKVATHPQEEGTKPENKPKNRYLTTFPYDHSRVKLRATTDNDYINANFIKSYYNDMAYIATQGPKITTMNDLWQMVWQEDVGKIVMVTKLQEGEKKKCDQYWPNSITEPLKLDTFTINMETEREHTVYIRRVLWVTHKGTNGQKKVLQFHFTQWPDHGVPDKISLVKLHRKVKAANVGSDTQGPLVVHCSAGLGRTGTYLALDALFEVGEKTGAVSVKQYTEIMRQDRMNMIQNINQYKIVHEALVEEFTVRDTSIPVTDFLQNKGYGRGKVIRKEFQDLQILKPKYGNEKYRTGNKPENISKNSVPGILPHDDYRPFIMSYGDSRNDYINAVIIPGYKQHNKYIVTQCPLAGTVGDFWSLVYDMQSSTIVLLEQVNKNVLLFPNEVGQELTYDHFVVTKIQSSSTDVSVSVRHRRCNETRNVTIHINNKWSVEYGTPTSVQQMADFMENVLKDQEKTENPLVIVCRDGCTRSGVFTTLSIVLEQIRMDDEIDIFQAVRRIQTRRPEFMPNVEQYQFCYQYFEEYLNKDTLYANM